jgi:general secretion pathway protein G
MSLRHEGDGMRVAWLRLRFGVGFTLVELLLVIVIIGILAAVILPSFVGRSEQARVAAARADIEGNLGVALDMFEADTGTYPTTDQGLQALIQEPTDAQNWRGPYLKKLEIPLDPWGRPYQYVCPGRENPHGYDLYSLGKDGEEGTDDDITNFPRKERAS